VSGGGKPRKRNQSLGEEIANSVSHGVGLLAALVAAPVLVIDAIQRGDPAGVGFFAAPPRPLYPFRLAPVRGGGYHVSLRRGPAIRRVRNAVSL